MLRMQGRTPASREVRRAPQRSLFGAPYSPGARRGLRHAVLEQEHPRATGLGVLPSRAACRGNDGSIVHRCAFSPCC